MKLVNGTDYPTKEMRRVLGDALGKLASARWLTVRVLRRAGGSGTPSEALGHGTTGPVIITLRLEPPRFFPADYSGQGYRSMSAENWQERLFFLAAHEANHVRLNRAGRGEEDSEDAADRVALRRLRGYRVRRFLRLA